MNKKEQRKLLTVWNETEEVISDLDFLDDVELVECRKVMRERLARALNVMDSFIDEDVFQA